MNAEDGVKRGEAFVGGMSCYANMVKYCSLWATSRCVRLLQKSLCGVKSQWDAERCWQQLFIVDRRN